MTQIGTAAEADAATGDFDGFGIPDTWVRIGVGNTRAAWLSPTGTVYKVGSDGANRAEDAAMRQLAQNPAARDAVPAHTLWETTTAYGDPVTVLAMEYVPDPLDDDVDVRAAWAVLIAVGDLNEDNIRVRDGRAYVIDFAGMTA